MTQGTIETVNYYTIKIGDAFLKEFKIGGIYGFADEQPYIRNMSLSGHEGDAYKWYFDSLAEVGEEDEIHQEKDFEKTLKLLEDNGMTCKVLKTTTVTTEKQKDVSIVDGKEIVEEDTQNSSESTSNNTINTLYHINKIFGITPAEAVVMLDMQESAKSIADMMKSVLSRLEDETNIK